MSAWSRSAQIRSDTDHIQILVSMEDEALKDSWTWLDEVLRLDSEAPSAMSNSVWDDDFSQSEAVVRNLFLTPSSSLHLKESIKSDSAQRTPSSSSWEIMPDCNPSPLKRRRIMQSNRDDIIDMSSLLIEHHGDRTNSLIEECNNFQAIGVSSTWLMSNEESLSSIEDTVEHSTGSKMEGCFSESETSDVQELFRDHIRHPLKLSASKSSLTRVKGDSLKKKPETGGAVSVTMSTHNSSNTSGKLILEPSELGQRHVLKESYNPVLAYPFALLKPSAIQGDLTLHDINKRINREPLTSRTTSREYKNTLPSPLSGKSVLALTRIYTEGKGTITIMKTRGESKQEKVITL